MPYRIIIALYGLINIAGGLMAFLSPNIRSVGSLIAGCGSGVLLLVFSFMAKTKPGIAFRGAAGLSLILALFWMFRITQVTSQGKSITMPMGNLVLAVVVFATLGAGHMLAMKKDKSHGA